MAYTARTEDGKKEYFDSPDVLEKKVDQLVQWITESKHMITFTGAGVSTAAGIPDFRSGMNTALSTGPGAWELRAQGAMRDAKKYKTVSTTKAIPTPTHMMFVKLQQEGIMKCCVSQNTDGLHRRSGLPKSALCELHGNSNLEYCKKCGREYLRDFRTRTAYGVFSHETGRKCDDHKCGGPLFDTIINFGENLPEGELTKAFHESEVADLCIAMGSSLTVTPAANIPQRIGERGQRLVIVNLQKTPLDGLASLRINAKCEEVSQLIMAKLGLPIPEFRLNRRVLLSATQDSKTNNIQLSIEGQDMFGYPFSLLKSVCVTAHGHSYQLVEPLQLSLPWKPTKKEEMVISVMLEFHAHYGEPPITRELMIQKDKDLTESLFLSYNPFNGQWTVTEEHNDIEEDLSSLTVK